MHRLLALGLLVFFLTGGCSGGGSASPFVQDGGDGADGADGGMSDSRTTDGPILGQPCLADDQCNDGVECTLDSCNHDLRRCQFVLDDSRCQNGVYCDGLERCDPDLGCRQGSILDCNDDMTCTIDRCVEATRMCTHDLRDADDDGHPDGHCQMAGDCNDADPTVYPGHAEVCSNAKDDNCDGKIDETPCQKPTHDTCLDPLVITKSGNYELDTTASGFDYPGTCAPMEATRKDVVAALQITGGPFDADLVAEAPGGTVAVGLGKECGILASEIACGKGGLGKAGNQIAHVRARSLAAGTYPLYVWVDRDEKVLLHVTLAPPTATPANETCGTAIPIALATPVVASLIGTKTDVATKCKVGAGDLVYQFDLPEAADVTVYGASIDGYGEPVVSIRREACAAPEDEIVCGHGAPARAFARALPKGRYFVAVSASLPTDVQLEVTATSPPVPPPADETCNGAPALVPNRTIGVSLASHTDDVDVGCAPVASVDAAYSLDLATTSDVLLALRVAQGDTGAVSLAQPACAASNLLCGKGGTSPVRASLRGVPAGSYRAVIESVLGNPVEVTAFVRPAVPPTLVPFADSCANATAIPETGGFFQGNTSNATADYSAGCDVTGVPPGGAADQMLKLVLSQRKRVVFDMQGSGYSTLLDVRKGATCPGLEMPDACSAGYFALRSYLDLLLDPGVYWVQVDGYASEQGPWFLDVRVVDP